jgi:hypothetical protein
LRISQTLNVKTIEKVKDTLSKIIDSKFESEEKIVEIISLVFKRQNKTDSLINETFNGLAIQNSILFE